MNGQEAMFTNLNFKLELFYERERFAKKSNKTEKRK